MVLLSEPVAEVSFVRRGVIVVVGLLGVGWDGGLYGRAIGTGALCPTIVDGSFRHWSHRAEADCIVTRVSSTTGLESTGVRLSEEHALKSRVTHPPMFILRSSSMRHLLMQVLHGVLEQLDQASTGVGGGGGRGMKGNTGVGDVCGLLFFVSICKQCPACSATPCRKPCASSPPGCLSFTRGQRDVGQMLHVPSNSNAHTPSKTRLCEPSPANRGPSCSLCVSFDRMCRSPNSFPWVRNPTPRRTFPSSSPTQTEPPGGACLPMTLLSVFVAAGAQCAVPLVVHPSNLLSF